MPGSASKKHPVSVEPWLVADSAYMRLGHVGPGWEQNILSMTAYSAASVVITGIVAGVKLDMTLQSTSVERAGGEGGY